MPDDPQLNDFGHPIYQGGMASADSTPSPAASASVNDFGHAIYSPPPAPAPQMSAVERAATGEGVTQAPVAPPSTLQGLSNSFQNAYGEAFREPAVRPTNPGFASDTAEFVGGLAGGLLNPENAPINALGGELGSSTVKLADPLIQRVASVAGPKVGALLGHLIGGFGGNAPIGALEKASSIPMEQWQSDPIGSITEVAKSGAGAGIIGAGIGGGTHLVGEGVGAVFPKTAVPEAAPSRPLGDVISDFQDKISAAEHPDLVKPPTPATTPDQMNDVAAEIKRQADEANPPVRHLAPDQIRSDMSLSDQLDAAFAENDARTALESPETAQPTTKSKPGPLDQVRQAYLKTQEPGAEERIKSGIEEPKADDTETFTPEQAAAMSGDESGQTELLSDMAKKDGSFVKVDLPLDMLDQSPREMSEEDGVSKSKVMGLVDNTEETPPILATSSAIDGNKLNVADGRHRVIAQYIKSETGKIDSPTVSALVPESFARDHDLLTPVEAGELVGNPPKLSKMGPKYAKQAADLEVGQLQGPAYAMGSATPRSVQGPIATRLGALAGTAGAVADRAKALVSRDVLPRMTAKNEGVANAAVRYAALAERREYLESQTLKMAKKSAAKYSAHQAELSQIRQDEGNAKKYFLQSLDNSGLRYKVGGKTFVDPSIESEYRGVIKADRSVIQGKGPKVIQSILTHTQLLGPVDFVAHTSRIFAQITNSPGGKNFMADLARKVPGVNIADAVGRIGSSIAKILQEDPTTIAQIDKLSKIGAMRNADGFLALIDRAGRVSLDTMYQNLVDRGLVENTERLRRNFSNQVGQYNSRLQTRVVREFRSSGLAPFITAGLSGNMEGIKSAMGSPVAEGRTKAATAQLWATQIGGHIFSLGVVPAVLNMVTTGKIGGRDGVPLGAIDTGKNDKDGNPLYIDPLKWVGVRRGLRATGTEAFFSRLQQGGSKGEALNDAWKQALQTWIHPFAGPAVQAGVTAATGYDTAGNKVREPVKPGDSKVAANFKAAAERANPTVAAFLQGHQTGGVQGGISSARASLGAAIGVGSHKAVSEGAKEGAELNEYRDDLKTRARQIPQSQRMQFLKGELKDLTGPQRTRIVQDIEQHPYSWMGK